ncbi:MAG: Crp/Fnr family transcriptional regulator [Firmicutes bacterium]|nr:Crp/Fnr family transcriptional regulator [Bacillota bacterium]
MNEMIFSSVFPFWDKLDDDDITAIKDGHITKTFEKGSVVHRSDMGCQGAILIQKGAFRVYIISEEGREVTLFRIREGECCVLSASCLLDSIQFDIFIETAEKTEAIVVPTTILNHIMEENPYVGLYMYQQATERFSEVMWTMQQILFMAIDKRVAIYLWDESISRGLTTIKTTHDEIAKNIGSAREVVTKVLNYFAEEGVVTLGRGRIEIADKEKLKTYL